MEWYHWAGAVVAYFVCGGFLAAYWVKVTGDPIEDCGGWVAAWTLAWPVVFVLWLAAIVVFGPAILFLKWFGLYDRL